MALSEEQYRKIYALRDKRDANSKQRKYSDRDLVIGIAKRQYPDKLRALHDVGEKYGYDSVLSRLFDEMRPGTVTPAAGVPEAATQLFGEVPEEKPVWDVPEQLITSTEATPQEQPTTPEAKQPFDLQQLHPTEVAKGVGESLSAGYETVGKGALAGVEAIGEQAKRVKEQYAEFGKPAEQLVDIAGEAYKQEIEEGGRLLGEKIIQPAIAKLRQPAFRPTTDEIKSVLETKKVPESLRKKLKMQSTTINWADKSTAYILNKYSELGLLPPASEFGEDYFATLIVAQKTPTQRKALTSALITMFEDARSSAVGLGKEPSTERGLTSLTAEHPVLGAIAESFVGLTDYPIKVIEHPEEWPKIAAAMIVGKIAFGPVMKGISKTQLGNKILSYDLLKPMRQWFKFKKMPITKYGLSDFLANAGTDIKGQSKEATSYLNYMSKAFRTASPEQQSEIINQMFKYSKSSGNYYLNIPRSYMKQLSEMPTKPTITPEKVTPPPSDLMKTPDYQQAAEGVPPFQPPSMAVPPATPLIEHVPEGAPGTPVAVPTPEAPTPPVAPVAEPPAAVTPPAEAPVFESRFPIGATVAFEHPQIDFTGKPKITKGKVTGYRKDPTTGETVAEIDGGKRAFDFAGDVHNIKLVDTKPAALSTEPPESAVAPEPAVAPEVAPTPTEVTPTPPSEPVAKEAWQMGRETYVNENSSTGQEVFRRYTLANNRSGKSAADKNAMSKIVSQERKHLGDKHYDAVTQAISEGKSVPPEVLAEYPDLQQPVTTGDTAEVTTEPAMAEPPLMDMAMETGLILDIEPAPAPPPEDMPTSQSDAYDVPDKPSDLDSAKEIVKDAIDNEALNPDEAGFAYIPGLEDFAKVGKRMVEQLKRLDNPERDIVIDVIGAIEKWRAETNKAGLIADWGQATLKKHGVSKNDAALINRYIDDPARYEPEYDKLPDNAKALGKALVDDYNRLKDIAIDAKVMSGWRENYMPHVWKQPEHTVLKTLYPKGGKLGKKFSFAQPRKIETFADGEAMGLTPIDDPILVNAIYKHQLYRTIANRNLIQTLTSMVREDGLPLIMGKPKNLDKLRIWENEYQSLNIPALNKYMYVSENVGAEGRPAIMIPMPAKADPEIAKILNNAFQPYAPKGSLARAFFAIKGRIKRVIMMNPAIHGQNIFSDALDEMNFRPIKTVKAIKRGHDLYKAQDELVMEAVENGLEMQSAHSLSVELKKNMMESSSKLHGALAPIGKIEQAVDKALWTGIVRNTQLGLYEVLTDRIAKEQPDWTRGQCGRVAAIHINTLLGTLPHTWKGKGLRTFGNFLFSPSWTYSNIDLVVRATTAGRKGFGTKGLTKEEQSRLGKLNIKHLIKGMFGMIAIANLIQIGRILMQNKMRDEGILDSEKEDVHWTFQNERGHWFDIDTGVKNKKGQTLYVVSPLFRYMRDYVGYAEDAMNQEAKTFLNKVDPLIKASADTLYNYSYWQKNEIRDPAMSPYQKIKKGTLYFVESISPSAYYRSFDPQEGYDPTMLERVIPFTGMWIRRGAPGGRFTGLLWQMQAEEGLKQDKLDNKIDEEIQKGDWAEALILMDKRYKTPQSKSDRIQRFVMPLSYYWRTASEDDKAKFIVYLKKYNYDLEEFKTAMDAEMSEVLHRAERDELITPFEADYVEPIPEGTQGTPVR